MENNLKLIKPLKKSNPNIHGTYEIEPELFLIHDGCIIDEKNYISINEYIQYDVNYFDIILHKGDNDIILGRYLKDFKNIMAAYKDNKILLYYADYNYSDSNLSKIIKVINLYNIEDDVFYSLTEKEALNVFDSEISTQYLIDPDNRLIEYNIDNKQKTLKKGISRFSYYGD